MGSVADLSAAFDGVNLADIVLKIVFLTVPCIALAHGLKRFRESGGGEPFGGDGRADRVKASLHRLGGKLASFITIVVMLAAGLGLVPLARAVYELISGVHPVAPALIGVALLALLLVKGLVMGRDLMDGKVDRPLLLLAPVPMFAVLIWVAPVIVAQITDQASQTVQMVMDEAKADEHDKKEDDKKEDKNDGPNGGAGHNDDEDR